MDNIVVIIPLHVFNEEIEPLLEGAIASVPKGMRVRISCPLNINEEISKWVEGKGNIEVFSLSEESDFQTLVNQAVDDTEYFSILEFDDEYTENWFKNVEEYIKYKPETSVFLPLEDIVDYKSNEYIGFGNEAPWASSFSSEIGLIDLECLKDYFNFYVTGGVFNTKDWKKIGGLKKDIKLTFWYEYLMRTANKGYEIYVIPKVGYVHYLGRDDSLIDKYSKEITEEESRYWFDVAKKNYMFKDKEIKPYTPKEKEN